MSHKPSRNFSHLRKFRLLEPVREPATKPKAGFEYLFEAENSKKISDWRADGWHWRQTGSLHISFEGVECKKVYFYTKIGRTATARYKPEISKDFMREVYFHPLFPNRVLIIYSGDEKVAVTLSHGNSKSKSKVESDFLMTRKSSRDEMKKRRGYASNIYTELILEAPKDLNSHVVIAPRDMEQVRNAQRSARRQLRMTHETSCNLQHISDETKFISDIVCYPSLMVFCYQPSLLDKVRGLLDRCDIPLMCFSYDTTVIIRDLYVSTLVVRFTEFDERPVIPIMFMIHERKTKSSNQHHFFWQKAVEYLPELEEATNIYIVSREERAIVEAITRFLSNAPSFRCWNDLFDHAKQKLRRMDITNSETVSRYVSNIRHLITRSSLVDYNRELCILSAGCWDHEFTRYFKKCIDPEIARIGRWELAEHGIDAITVDHCDSLDYLIKCIQLEWKNAPVDSMVLCLYHLSLNYENRILRGRYAIGDLRDYNLRSHLAELYTFNDDAPPDMPDIESPEEIIARLRNACDEGLQEIEAGENQDLVLVENINQDGMIQITEEDCAW